MKHNDFDLNLTTRRIRKEVMLDEMSVAIPWAQLVALIAAHVPAAKIGRSPFQLEIMLRIHCLQRWFGLSDLASEEAMFEKTIYSDVVGLRGTHTIPDRVSIQRFHYLLETHHLSPRVLQIIDDIL